MAVHLQKIYLGLCFIVPGCLFRGRVGRDSISLIPTNAFGIIVVISIIIMYSRGNLLRNGSDGYDLRAKRQRHLEPSSYYGGSPASLQASLFYGGGSAALPPSYFAQPRPFPAVRLRGLPFNCTESDVYEFFAGLDLVDVLLVHKDGRFSGEAYCVFGAPLQVDYSLQKDRKYMGLRYVEVFRSEKSEYYQAVAAEATEGKNSSNSSKESDPARTAPKSSSDKDHLEHTGVLKLRGLPFSASKRDIIEFFKEFDLTDENVHIVVRGDGRTTGEAFVQFKDADESRDAVCKDKMILGTRYIELFPSSHKEAVAAAAKLK